MHQPQERNPNEKDIQKKEKIQQYDEFNKNLSSGNKRNPSTVYEKSKEKCSQENIKTAFSAAPTKLVLFCTCKSQLHQNCLSQLIHRLHDKKIP